MRKSHILCCLFLVISLNVSASNDHFLQKQLDRLGLKNPTLSHTPIDQIEMVTADNGLIYISRDGKYLFDGKMYAISTDGVTNLTNKTLLARLRADKTAMITFPATVQKYAVYVFIDTTCRYCHLMFEQIKSYNHLGITLYFLPFPRKGLDSIVAQQMEAIWTANDPAYALIQAESEHKYPTQMKEPNIVKKQYILANQLGITGVPAIILENGEILSGYLPPEHLLRILEQQ